MNWIIPSLVMAGSWFTDQSTESQRIKKLSSVFDPKPGTPLVLSAQEIREYSATKRLSPMRLRGYITVSPPPHTCLTITRSEEEEDLQVCKRTVLSFALENLDRAGFLRWRVITGAGDYGTPLIWPSHYRVGIVTLDSKTLEDVPDYVFLDSCRAISDPVQGRLIHVGLLSGEQWTVRFPDLDDLEPQPDPIPNLDVMTQGGKMSLKDASDAKAAESAPAGTKDVKEVDKEKGESAEKPKAEGEKEKEGGEKAAGEDASKTKAAPHQREDRTTWAIPARHAMHMNASAFQPNGSVPPGMNGICRYIYHGPAEDPETGRLECHDVDGYRAVYLPLTCLKELAPTGS